MLLHPDCTSSRWALNVSDTCPDKSQPCFDYIRPHNSSVLDPFFRSDARITGRRWSFRSNTLRTQKWKEKVMKKTALLKPVHVEMTNVNPDKYLYWWDFYKKNSSKSYLDDVSIARCNSLHRRGLNVVLYWMDFHWKCTVYLQYSNTVSFHPQ